MATLLAFEQILGERNVPLRESRLLRHDGRGRDEWRRGRAAFGHFASYQSRRPYNRCRYAFQFIPDTYAAIGVPFWLMD